MTPTIIGNCTLYNADCRDVIPTLTDPVDLVLTDPPYGTEEIVGGYSRNNGGALIANDKDLTCCMEALRLTAAYVTNAPFAVFYSPRVRRTFFDTIPDGLKDFGELIWDKKMPGMGKGIRYQHENIAFFYTGSEPKFTKDFTWSIVHDSRVAGKVDSKVGHPHQKPVGLLRQIVETVGCTSIFDPFMGSGSTGVVAKEMGKKFIGIELDPKHFDTCCKRIEAAQLDMFAVQVVEKQVGLFADNDNSPSLTAVAA